LTAIYRGLEAKSLEAEFPWVSTAREGATQLGNVPDLEEGKEIDLIRLCMQPLEVQEGPYLSLALYFGGVFSHNFHIFHIFSRSVYLLY
jgi:hypothetical protein